MPTKTTRTYSVGELKQAAYNAGFRGNDLVIAVAVSLAENPSRDPRAVHVNSNGTVDRGAWQINSVHKYAGNPYDLQTNANQAYKVFTKQGWRAWSVYRTKKYAAKLTTAQQANTVGNPSTGTSYPLGGGLLPSTAATTPAPYPASQGKAQNDPSGGLFGDAADVAGDVAGGIGDAIGEVAGWTSSLGKLLAHLLDPGFWKRVGAVALGVLILVIGLVILLGGNKTIRQGVELAATKGMVSESSE